MYFNKKSGIIIGSHYDNVQPNIVVNNTCNNNYRGIAISRLLATSATPVQVINNTCNFNNQAGIYLMYLDSNFISNNVCNFNNYFGYFW